METEKGKGEKGPEEQGRGERKWERAEHNTEDKMRRGRDGDQRWELQRWRSWKLFLPMKTDMELWGERGMGAWWEEGRKGPAKEAGGREEEV